MRRGKPNGPHHPDCFSGSVFPLVSELLRIVSRRVPTPFLSPSLSQESRVLSLCVEAALESLDTHYDHAAKVCANESWFHIYLVCLSFPSLECACFLLFPLVHSLSLSFSSAKAYRAFVGEYTPVAQAQAALLDALETDLAALRALPLPWARDLGDGVSEPASLVSLLDEAALRAAAGEARRGRVHFSAKASCSPPTRRWARRRNFAVRLRKSAHLPASCVGGVSQGPSRADAISAPAEALDRPATLRPSFPSSLRCPYHRWPSSLLSSPQSSARPRRSSSSPRPRCPSLAFDLPSPCVLIPTPFRAAASPHFSGRSPP